MSSPLKKKIPTHKVRTKAKPAPRTERTGRASERVALATLDALSAHIAILDRSGAIIAVNRAWRNFAKANHQSLAGVCEGANYLSVCDAARGPDAAIAADFALAVRAIIRGKRREFSLEYPCHSPNEERWFDVRVTRFPGKGAARVVVSHENITGRKQSEAALRDAHQLTRQIFSGAREGIVVYGADMRYQVWNAYMEELTGVPAAQVLGRHPLEVFPFLRETGVIAMIERALAGESPPPCDLAFRVPQTGRSGWVSDWTAPLRNSSGVIIGVVGMVRDITARKRTEEELHTSHEHLRALAARLQAVREEERTRIAREIHDELGQQLTGLKMDLRWLEHGLEDLRDSRANALIDKTMEATGLLDATVKTVQRIAADLRPAVLDKLGLVAALRREARQVQQHLGIACTLTGLGIEPQLPALVAITCFRIFQEAMTNVARHAAATAVEVELKTQPDGLVLEVRDNGKGIPPAIAVSAATLGLIGMRERARAVGGTVTFAPRAEGGTVVRLEIPVPGKE